MTIHLYTLCFNEMDILPFCVDYWKRFASHVTVYDNGSTDGSVEFLQHFDWIEVRSFQTDGMDTQKQTDIKNQAWKESKGKADWVVVCDTDELLFSNHLEEVLKEMQDGGYTALGCKWYQLLGDDKPQYEEGKLLHELIPRVAEQQINNQDKTIGKILLFNPNAVESTNYGVGCHAISPNGNYRLYKTDKALIVHVEKGFGIDYKLQGFKERNERRSNKNKQRGFGTHYAKSEAVLSEEYKKLIDKSVDINQVIK